MTIETEVMLDNAEPATLLAALMPVVKYAQNAGWRVDVKLETYEEGYKGDRNKLVSLTMRMPLERVA